MLESATESLLRLKQRAIQSEKINPTRIEVVMNQQTSASTHILSGWKDIASYLGRGVRTVQRYEEELRLPVRRPVGRVRGFVVCTKAELDAWISASPVRKEFQVTLMNNAHGSLPIVAVKQGIQEMRALREQMRGLRDDLRRSMFLLHQNILVLQGGVANNSHVSMESDPFPPGTAELASTDLSLPKAG